MTKKELLNLIYLGRDHFNNKRFSIEPYNRQIDGFFIVECLHYLLSLSENCLLSVDGSGFNIDGLYEIDIHSLDADCFVWNNYTGHKYNIFQKVELK